MNTAEFAKRIGGTIVTGDDGANAVISTIYCGDLLSWVMSHAPKGSAWITVHTHMNILAVASLVELSSIILPEGIEAEAATVKRAAQEGIPIICSPLSAFEICCIAHDNGL